MTFGGSELGGLFGDAGGTFADSDPTWPSFTFELSLDADPLAEVTTWTDITDYVTSFTITRGRTEETEYAAGVLALELDDPDRDFDPDNAASPLYPAIADPRRRVRVLAEWDTTTYALFDGWLDDREPLDYATVHDHATINLTATDALGMLAGRTMRPARPFTIGDPILGVLDDPTIALLGSGGLEFDQQRTGQRIDRLLEVIGWPEHLRAIDQGLTTVLADTADGDALAYLQRLSADELGDLYADTDGTLTFRERRHWTRNSRATTSTVTYSDDLTELDAGALPYTTLRFRPSSVAQLRNVVRRARADGREASAQDNASIDAHGVAEDVRTDSLIADPAELADQASYLLSRYSDPQPWVEALTVAYDPDPTTHWPAMLATEFYDLVTVTRSPVVGTPVTRTAWVCGMQWAADARTRTAELTLTLQPPETASYFTIGDVVLGKLDDVATLAY